MAESMNSNPEKGKFEVITGNKTKESTIASKELDILGAKDSENKDRIGGTVVESLVKDYIKGTQKRLEELAREQLKITMSGREKKDRRVSRVLESKFQNDLLHILAPMKNRNMGDLSLKIKKSLVNNLGERKDTVEIQRAIEGVVVGVESCLVALHALENESKYKENTQSWIGTNNVLDAEHKIDLIQGIEHLEEGIKELNLVQVKSHSEGSEQIKDITDSHQNYINTLPQLIGLLNTREAEKIAEDEFMNTGAGAHVLDADRSEEIKNQMALFGMVLDGYIDHHAENLQQLSATELYNDFQNNGGNLNPFTFMGILKNKKVLETYRNENYFSGNPAAEKILAETSHLIPYQEKESLMFYKAHHTKTILEATKINSTIMVKDKKISTIELQNPLI